MDRSTRRPCRHGAAVLGALAAAWWALAPAAVAKQKMGMNTTLEQVTTFEPWAFGISGVSSAQWV